MFHKKSCCYEVCNVTKIPVVESLKITCFEENLQTAASIRCYFDSINVKQSGFSTISPFKIFDSERKYKNNLKNRESQKNIFYNSHI